MDFNSKLLHTHTPFFMDYTDEILMKFEEIYGTNPRFITNFNKKKEPLYRAAIEKYGKPCLRIYKDAYDCTGRKMEDCLSLRCDADVHDLSDFWEIFREMEKEFNLDSI